MSDWGSNSAWANIDVRGIDQYLVELQDFLQNLRSATIDFSLIYGAEGSIYHYTDLNGFKGIVESHNLWLSDSRYSNDAQEMRGGYQIANDVIDGEYNALADPEWRPFLDDVKKRLNQPLATGVYICCFCQKDDLLSQWRGYGANGGGVSIAFDAQGFHSVTGQDSPAGGLTRLWKVFYAKDLQEGIVRETLKYGFKLPVTLAERARKAADYIQFFIPTFKDQGFSEEQELRLIFTPPPDFVKKPKTRSGRGMLIPYYNLQDLIVQPTWSDEIQRLPITGVRVGPSANQVLNIASIDVLLKANGYGSVQPITLGPSTVPYRG